MVFGELVVSGGDAPEVDLVEERSTRLRAFQRYFEKQIGSFLFDFGGILAPAPR